MIRKQKFSGLWYPNDSGKLKKIIELTPVSDNKGLFGVVPHAGLYYSSSLIKLFFSTLNPKVNKMLLITPSHYYVLPSDVVGSSKIDEYECILGNIPGFSLPVFEPGYEEVTKSEHAVEMILPFISTRKNISLCCAHVNHFTDVNKASDYAKKLLSTIDDKTAVVASSDFTHYGERFGHIPYGSIITDELVRKVITYDTNIANRFVNGNGRSAYLQAMINDNSTICGIAPILLVSEMARFSGMKGKILGQSNSLEKSNSENNFVSYVSIVWRK